MPSQLTAAEFKQHKKMMETPDDWPLWPILPLKGPNLSAGIMIAAQHPHRTRVYLCNLWQLKPGLLAGQLEQFEFVEYQDFEAILDAGWRVD